MAKPCVVTYKGKEHPYKEWINLLHKGELDRLIESKVITINEKGAAKGAAAGRQVTPTPIVEEVVAVEGSTVKLPPLFQGGMERTMVFKDGNWQQEVGGSLNRVGDKVQAQADEAFKASKKAEVVNPILSKNIDIESSEGKKGLVPISELEEFIGEDRLGEAQMTTSRATIDKLKEDISKNGFKEPIVIVYDKFSNGGEATIVEGNHRIIAAKELGLTEIPVRFEKGTIRDNESRVKDKMFPIKRKVIGKFDDTKGVKGSDLGLTVRQPTEADFVKTTETTPTVEAPKVEAKEEEVTPTQEEVIQEEEEEQYEPITVSDTSHDTFTKDNAVDYEEDEKEGDNGRSYTYLSSVTVELTDNNSGDTIGTISKLKSEDGEVTYSAEDADGNLVAEEVSTKAEAQQAVVDKWNKQKLKEFNKEKAAEKKAKAKEAEKAKKKAGKEMPAKTKSEQIGEGLLNLLGIGNQGGTKGNGVNVNNKSALSDLEGKTTGNKRAIIEAAKKAIATLKSVFPEMDIYIHEDNDSYNEAMEDVEVGGVKNSAGNFAYEIDANGNQTGRGRIDINLSKANSRTVAHEVSHAVMLKAFGDNPALFKSFRDKISKVLKDSSNKALMDFANQYVDEQGNLLDVTYEEYLAELTGALAAQEGKLSPTTLQKIAELINQIVSKLTNGKLRPFEDIKDTKQVVEFFSNIANSIRAGEDISNINDIGVSGTINATGVKSKSSLSSGEIKRFPVNKNVVVEEDVPMSKFDGKKSNLIESDRMTGGYVADSKGNPLFRFYGGVFYPIITGKWWASRNETKARAIAENGNNNRDADGYVYCTPMIGSDKQHMSNTDMLSVTVELMKLDVNDKKSRVKKIDIVSSIEKAFNRKDVKNKNVLLDNILKKSNNINEIFDELEFALFQEGDNILDRNNSPILDSNGKAISNFSFEERLAIVNTILGDPKVKDVKFPSAGTISDAAKRFEEPVTAKAKAIGDVVTVMRTKGTLKYKKTENTDPFYHKSYPVEIYAVDEQGNAAEIEVYVLDGAYGMKETFPSLTQSSGKVFTWDEYIEKHKSQALATAQYNRTAKLSSATGRITSKSQKGSDISIEPIDFENESENIDVYEASNTAEKIAKDNGVNILRGKELRSVALNKNGDVVGGLWTEISNNEFSFDIAVDKSTQGKGAGEKLVNDAISEFNAQDYEGELKYKIDVTNPIMEKLLSKYGFEAVDKFTGHTIMEHPTNNPKITSKSQKPQNSQIKDYIESQRAAGESDADIRAGIESVADRIGLTEEDINDLMSTTPKDTSATQPSGETQKPIKKKKRRKSLLNRAFRGTTDQKVLDNIQKYGLFYETENQAEAQKDAKEFVRVVGDEAALKAVRDNLIVGGRAAFVYAQVIDNVMLDMANAKNVQEAESLLAIQGELIAEFDKRARDIGQFNSALNRVYQTSNFNYSLSRQIKKYKDMNNGVIPKEVEAKMKELEAQLKEVNEQLKEAKARAKEAEEKEAIDNIKEDVNRNKEKETYTQKAKKVADKFRARFKTKPKFYDENGNEIEVFTAGFTWNDLVEEAAKAIQRTGQVADGLKAVVDFVKDSDVYKKLTKKGKEALDGQINNYFGDEKTSGRVKVPHSLIRRLVEEGNTDMDSLVAAVKQEMLEEYPDATDREIRDGITGYGKTVNQNQEEIEKQIRKLKFLGRAQSALEDIAMKKRPLKSGAQRDKLDADERKLLKEIKEAMKDLPVDLETQDAQLKTALDAAKTRIRNRIEDLNNEIKSGEVAKKNNKPTITDQEYKDLVAQRDELQYQHDLIFKGKPQTVGEKKIKALEKQLDDLLTKEIKGQEDSATFSEAEQKQIDALKDKINAAKEEMGLIASKPLPKTEMEKAEAREKAKIEALEKQLEDLKQGIIQDKKDKAKTQESQEVKDLKAQIQKEKEFLGLIPAKPTEIQLMEMVYDKAISDINDKIKNNDLAFNKPENKAFIPELEAKRERLNAAKEELKKMREEAGIIEARRLENAKNSVNRRIAELERRIREKDFSKKKPKPLVKDNELIKLNAKKLRIKAEFDKLQYQNELNNRNKVQKFYDGLLEVWGLPRALLATGEFSFMLIQGGIYTLGNWRIARSSFSGAMKALANENKAKQQLKYIQAQEWYPVMKASKLALTEPDAKLEAREEQFLGGWVNYIWDIAGYPSRMGGEKLYEGWKKLNPIRAVERAGVSYLNMIRVQKFLEGSEMLQAQGKTFETHPQDYKNVADVVNTFTGRASLGKGEQFSKELSAVFFSPRNWASMIKQASPYAIYHIGKMGSREEGQSSLSLLMKGKVTPSVAQKMAIKDFLKYSAITAGFVVMAAIKYNDDDDDETEVSLDPTSSDFLKIKLGNTRVDPWGGKIQQVVLTNRIISSLSGGDGKALDYAGKMIVNKFNPSASMTYKYLNAKKDSEGLTLLDQYGNPISMKEDLWNSVRPIYWQSFAEINKENPTARAGLLHLYGFFGGGIQTYKTPTQIMKDKNVFYDDLENNDVVGFKQQIEKSEDKLSQADIDELTATYAKEIKDLNRQVEKGLVKETQTQKALIEKKVVKKYKEDLKTVTSEEKLEKALGELKTASEKANKLKNEFARYSNRQKKWVAVKSISSQENKIKKLIKKGVIDKAVENQVYRLMVDINAENKE